MSFKREGDDKSQLNVLKKRRVADLLSNFISEDEASLLKNGSYACIVCSHRPVFNTVEMLMVHRKGRRHLEGMKWFYGKKNQLRQEIVKRKHQVYVKAEDDGQEPSSSAPLLTQTRKITHHALLKTTPYNSCHKKISGRLDSSGCSSQRNPNVQVGAINTPIHYDPWLTTKSPDAIATTSVTEQEETDEKGQLKRRKKGTSSVKTTECEPLPEQRRQEMEHYLKLKSSGWIQDRSGKWVKDENVEFDSDEEEPAHLPPSSHSL